MDLVNLTVGISLCIMGTAIIFVGNYFSRKIGIFHVMIYFVASFVILAGVLMLMLYARPSIL